MELIKKIKQAETEAQEIIEKANADAAKQAEKGRANRLRILAEAEQERKEAIEAAVATAQSQGLAETEQLKAQAETRHQELRDKAADKMAGAVTKVMEYLSKPSS